MLHKFLRHLYLPRGVYAVVSQVSRVPCKNCQIAHNEVFYKYFLKHPDLRERTAVTNSYDGFEQIVAELKARVTDDSEYDEVIAQT